MLVHVCVYTVGKNKIENVNDLIRAPPITHRPLNQSAGIIRDANPMMRTVTVVKRTADNTGMRTVKRTADNTGMRTVKRTADMEGNFLFFIHVLLESRCSAHESTTKFLFCVSAIRVHFLH